MKIFITGGAGFIGSNFVHYWVEKYPKDKVVVYDSLTYAGNIENLKDIEKKITFVKGDLLDRDKLKESLKGVDTVVHFAAESHVDKSVFNPAIFWETNVEGTRKLLQEADKAGVWRFHHVSTDEVYGELPLNSDIKFNEETPYSPRPENPYAVSKAEADRVVTNFAKESKMHLTISNCSNNFGPFMFPEKFIAISITNLIDGLQVPVHGDGQNVAVSRTEPAQRGASETRAPGRLTSNPRHGSFSNRGRLDHNPEQRLAAGKWKPDPHSAVAANPHVPRIRLGWIRERSCPVRSAVLPIPPPDPV